MSLRQSQMESDLQFACRMLVATREGHQISSADAQRLNDLAMFGDSLHNSSATTMPEERRSGSVPIPGDNFVPDMIRD